jgi:hypothetical protein
VRLQNALEKCACKNSDTLYLLALLGAGDHKVADQFVVASILNAVV